MLRALLPIELGPLSEAEAKNLIAASNLSRPHGALIRVPDDVLDAAYQVTGGDPWWLQALGDAMWHLARNTATGQVRYTPKMLRRALDKIVLEEQYRFRGRLRSDDEIHWRILTHLAGQDVEGGTAESNLHAALSSELGFSTRAELVRKLYDMKDWGAVAVEMVDDAPIWTTAAPLLAEAVRIEVKRSGGSVQCR